MSASGGGFEDFEDFEIQKTALIGSPSQPTPATPETSFTPSDATNGIHPSSTDDGKESADDFEEVTL